VDQAFPRKNTLMVHLRAVHMHEKVEEEKNSVADPDP
jgi:hypothetical protein